MNFPDLAAQHSSSTSLRTGRGLLRLLGRTFMLVALDKGGEVGSCPPHPHLAVILVGRLKIRRFASL